MISYRSLRSSPLLVSSKIDGVQAMIHIFPSSSRKQNLYVLFRNGCVYSSKYDYSGEEIIIQVTVCDKFDFNSSSIVISSMYLEDLIKYGHSLYPSMDYYYRLNFFKILQLHSFLLRTIVVKEWTIYDDEKVEITLSPSVEGLIFQGVNSFRKYTRSTNSYSIIHPYYNTSVLFLKDNYTVDLDIKNNLGFYLKSSFVRDLEDGIYEFEVKGNSIGEVIRPRFDKSYSNSYEVQQEISVAVNFHSFFSLILENSDDSISVEKAFPKLFLKFTAREVMTNLDEEEVRNLVSSGITKLKFVNTSEDMIASFYEWRYQYITYVLRKMYKTSNVTIPSHDELLVQDYDEVAKFYLT